MVQAAVAMTPKKKGMPKDDLAMTPKSNINQKPAMLAKRAVPEEVVSGFESIIT
jgi:hypothetical protein